MSFEVVGEKAEVAQQFEALSAERKALQAAGSLPDWYTTQGWQMFKSKYSVEGEDAVRGRHRTIAKTLARHMIGREAEWEERFFDLMWRGVLSPASPALANTGTDRGMPVSCSGQVVGDSVDSFYKGLHETASLSKYGFGTSVDFSSIRPRGSKVSNGGKANGAVPVIEDFFICASKISQGGSRRGSVAAYLDIEHVDWDEAIDGLESTPDGKNYGWVIKDSFVDKLKAGDKEANRRFSRALYVKMVTGKGYLFFVDKANRARPQMYKDLGLEIKASNLCSEVVLHSSDDLSFSCILSSLNLLHWDKIKESSAVFDATVFLDCLVSEFLEKSEGIPGLEKVREFTRRGRAIGLGVMGFSTYLQENRIPYGSLEAQFLNQDIFEHLQKESLRASQWLAQEYGEPEWCKGYGVRNTHRTAVAPTKSTSLLMGGVSESVFPDPGMVFDAGSSVGDLRRIPPAIYELMKERGVYSKETLDDIVEHIGSVQHVDWLTEEEKAVFLTAFEIKQDIILRYASQRQQYLCQGQSLNFYVAEDSAETEVSKLLSEAVLDENILGVYYVYSRSGVVVKDECLACQA
jgi:ribonucleoside-diphosphate reductase alpha chain